MEVQGHKENFVPQTHIHLIRGLKGTGVYPGENFYSQRGYCIQQCPLWHGQSIIAILQALGPTAWDSLYIWTLTLHSGAFAHHLSHCGNAHEVQLRPHNRVTPESIDTNYILPAFPTTGGIVPNPHQPVCHRSVDLARTEPGGASTSGWVPVPLILSGSRWEDTHCDCVLCHCQDNPVSIA